MSWNRSWATTLVTTLAVLNSIHLESVLDQLLSDELHLSSLQVLITRCLSPGPQSLYVSAYIVILINPLIDYRGLRVRAPSVARPPRSYSMIFSEI